jgi:hypothetical protein
MFVQLVMDYIEPLPPVHVMMDIIRILVMYAQHVYSHVRIVPQLPFALYVMEQTET